MKFFYKNYFFVRIKSCEFYGAKREINIAIYISRWSISWDGTVRRVHRTWRNPELHTYRSALKWYRTMAATVQADIKFANERYVIYNRLTGWTIMILRRIIGVPSSIDFRRVSGRHGSLLRDLRNLLSNANQNLWKSVFMEYMMYEDIKATKECVYIIYTGFSD